MRSLLRSATARADFRYEIATSVFPWKDSKVYISIDAIRMSLVMLGLGCLVFAR